MAEMQWARLNADVDSPLRRGAWYRVLSLTTLEVFVDVQGASVPVARPFVDLRPAAPQEWTVVSHVKETRQGPERLRSGYVVCPTCRNRAVLPFARVLKLRCPRCNELFPIAWDQQALKNPT
jgi:hypothetical protein